YDVAACVSEGTAAGEMAARMAGEPRLRPASTKNDSPTDLSAPSPQGVPARMEGVAAAIGPAGRAFIDFQNDVTTKDIRLALREGFRSIEHVKRYTTAGMATDQGKTSNMNALSLLAAAEGKPVPEVGLTTF